MWNFLDLAEAIQAVAGPRGWQKAEFTPSCYAPPTPQIACLS
jgi:hypothetical protein